MNTHIINIIRSCLKAMPVDKAWLFGSYARGEENQDSDVDIMVCYCSGVRPGLFGIIEMTDKLEQLLGKRVDLVEKGTLYPRVAKEVESQKILIYERR